MFACSSCVLKSLPLLYRQRAAGAVRNKLPGEPGDSERGEVQPRGVEHHLLVYAGDLPKHQPTCVRSEPVFSSGNQFNSVEVDQICFIHLVQLSKWEELLLFYLNLCFRMWAVDMIDRKHPICHSVCFSHQFIDLATGWTGWGDCWWQAFCKKRNTFTHWLDNNTVQQKLSSCFMFGLEHDKLL